MTKVELNRAVKEVREKVTQRKIEIIQIQHRFDSLNTSDLGIIKRMNQEIRDLKAANQTDISYLNSLKRLFGEER